MSLLVFKRKPLFQNLRTNEKIEKTAEKQRLPLQRVSKIVIFENTLVRTIMSNQGRKQHFLSKLDHFKNFDFRKKYHLDQVSESYF